MSVDRFTFMSSRKENGLAVRACVCVRAHDEDSRQEELTATTFVKLI